MRICQTIQYTENPCACVEIVKSLPTVRASTSTTSIANMTRTGVAHITNSSTSATGTQHEREYYWYRLVLEIPSTRIAPVVIVVLRFVQRVPHTTSTTDTTSTIRTTRATSATMTTCRTIITYWRRTTPMTSTISTRPSTPRNSHESW